MLLVQHDLIFFVVRCFCGWYSNIKHLFQYIVLQCKKHVDTHTCCETSCQGKGWIFSKEIRKNFHLGRQTFRLLPYLQVGTSEEKLYFGVFPISVCSLYIFPKNMSLFKAPKKIDILRLFPPPEEVHQSTLCRWPRTSTCWHPKPRCFLEPQTTLFDRRPRGGGFPGGNKNIGNFQYRWRKSENRWLSFFFVCFWCFCFDSWKLYWWMFSFLFGSFRWNFRWCASWRTKLSLRVTKHILWLKKIKQ